MQLLASILVMIALYSVNLRVMGKPNVALISEPTVFAAFEGLLAAPALQDEGIRALVVLPIMVDGAPLACLNLASLTRDSITLPLVWQEQSLQMEWCLECHRNPQKYVRPKSEVFNVAWEPPANQLELGRQLVKEYGIHPRTSCSTCHR